MTDDVVRALAEAIDHIDSHNREYNGVEFAREMARADAELERLARQAAAMPVVDSLPIRQSFSLAGTFRVSFNRHQAAPLVWCIASEHLEIAVAGVTIDAPTTTVYRPKATPDDEDGRPSAWIQVTGVLTVDGADVRITRAG